MRRRRWSSLLFFILPSCAASRSVQAPVDIQVMPVATTPANRIAENGLASSGGCTLRLTAKRIQKSQQGCYLDEHISRGPGTLHFPCGGDGVAEADFGENRYRGKIEQGNVHLELRTELDWEDGCRWGTQAFIDGTISQGGEGALQPLAWSYHDSVLSGKDCSGVCTARASIDVTREAARRPVPDEVEVDSSDD